MASVAGHRGGRDGAHHRQQATQTEHGTIARRPCRKDRHRSCARAHRGSPVAEDGQAEEAEEDTQVADRHRQHVAVVRHGPGATDPALGARRRRGCHHRGGQAVVLAELHRIVLVLPGRYRHYLTMELYAGFRPEKSQAFLTSTRAWIDTHTDQVIIVVSLVLGFWLVGKSIYLVVT